MPPRALPRIHRLFPGVFYGWLVAFGSGVLAFAAVGIGFYGQTVLLEGLVSQRGWPLARVAGASTLFFVIAGAVGPAIGVGVDRFGARGAILLGLATMGLALVAAGRADAPGELVLLDREEIQPGESGLIQVRLDEPVICAPGVSLTSLAPSA